MTASLVIDCSITMSWCFAEEATTGSKGIQDRLVRETAVVPTLWFLEIANVLAMAEKHNRLTVAASTEFLKLLDTLEIEVDDEAPSRAFDHLLPLCRAHRLTSYDAVYLDLASRRQLPLATLDAELRTAAEQLGVAVLGT